ncbi:MAG: ABC transporter ATP-binding protein [Lachnospiraceae bacterium]|nr:ABC transporter ATP-binding protein [Lachnospiraceae bacterium]
MSYLEVNQLTKVYGVNDTRVIALDHVSFSVEKGEFVAIVGTSGSGKSTLLSLLGGVDTPTSGSVTLDGEKVFDLKGTKRAEFRRRKIGFIFQEYNLIPVLNVEENIEIPVRLDGIRLKPEQMTKLLIMLNMEERRYHLPEELSGGQKQRVAIGRAYAHKPALILADEPTGNLDHATSVEIMDLLRTSAEKYGQTLIVVTHDDNIAATADRIIRISDGKIESDIRLRNRDEKESDTVAEDPPSDPVEE